MTTSAVQSRGSTGRASLARVKRWAPYAGPAATGLLTLIAFFIRAHAIGAPNLWLDESNSWLLATYSFADLLANVRHSPSGPLYFILLKGWTGLFGQSEAALRSMSLLASLPLLPLTYVMGVRVLSRPAAVTAVLLLAVSPLQLYFAQEARVYMLATLTAACATAAYLRWRVATAAELSGHPSVTGAAGALALYVVSSVASLYTLGLTGLLLAALGLDAVLLLSGGDDLAATPAPRRVRLRMARPWVIAQLAVLVVSAPLVLALDSAGAISSQAWRGPMGVDGAVRNLIEYFLVTVHGLYFYPWDLYPAVTQHWGREVVTRLVVVFPSTILAIVTAFAYPPIRSLRGGARALWLALLLPLLFGAVLSIWHELSLTRYMLFASPYFALLLGAGLTRAPKWLSAPMLGILLASALYGLVQYPTIRSRDTDFRSIARELADSTRATDVVLVQPPEAGVQLSYYLRTRPVLIGGIPAGASLKGLLHPRPGTRTWFALDYRSRSYSLSPDSLRATLAEPVARDQFDGSGDHRVRLIRVDGAITTVCADGLVDTTGSCRVRPRE